MILKKIPFRDIGCDEKHFPAQITLLNTSGAFLLPHGILPMFLADKEDKRLMDHVMGQGRYLGLVLPRPMCAGKPFYDIGCLGRIITFVDRGTEPHFVLLKGMIRFQALDHTIHPSGFSKAHVSYDAYFDDLRLKDHAMPEREDFMSLLKEYAKHADINPQWEELALTSDEALVAFLTMLSPLGTPEKQAILEMPSLEDRCQLISALQHLQPFESSFLSRSEKKGVLH